MMVASNGYSTCYVWDLVLSAPCVRQSYYLTLQIKKRKPREVICPKCLVHRWDS